MFNFRRGCQTFTKQSIISHLQNNAWVPVAPHHNQRLVSFVWFFSIFAILIGSDIALWLFICVSLMTNVEYLFICLFAVYISFLTRYLFKSFAHLFSWVIYFFITEFWQFFLHSGYSPLSVTYFANVCSQSVACLLVLLTVSCINQKYVLWWSLLNHFFFHRLCVYWHI